MPKKLDSWIKNSNTHASILDLQCHGIQYGERTVLAPFHLQLVEGQHVAILGSSGAGKTTLLRVIFDFLSTSSVKTALIPQTAGLVENISVYHNVYMGRLDQFSTISNLLNLLIPKTSAKNTIQSILDTLSVGDKIFSPCGALSGGQQQRVAIARAIYRHASILIADEPVANLDQNQAEIALQTMIDTHANCVLALHNTEQALRYCNRIIGINSGKLVLDKPADQVTAQDLTDVYKTPDVQSVLIRLAPKLCHVSNNEPFFLRPMSVWPTFCSRKRDHTPLSGQKHPREQSLGDNRISTVQSTNP